MQSDKDWARRRHELNDDSSSRGHGRGQHHAAPRNALGLGHGQRALTSSMLSEQNDHVLSSSNSPATLTFHRKSNEEAAKPTASRRSRFSDPTKTTSASANLMGFVQESEPKRGRWDTQSSL